MAQVRLDTHIDIDNSIGYKIIVYDNININTTETIPSIFMSERPGCLRCYYGGPIIPTTYWNELQDYITRTKYPLQILEKPEDRKILAKNIGILSSTKDSLFDIDPIEVENDLEGILRLKKEGHAIYKQWTQNVNGKIRDLATPREVVEHFQKAYVKSIISHVEQHPKAHGGERTWSPEKSISTHLPLTQVLTCDLINAFNILEIDHVFDFYYEIAQENINNKSEAIDAAGFLATTSTVYQKSTHSNTLPIGSPISMMLFNRILKPLDELFHDKCMKKNLTYSRWVDDIIISSNDEKNVYSKIATLIRHVREKYRLPMHKIFFQDKPPFYILGNAVSNKEITKADDTLKNSRKELDGFDFLTQMDYMMDLDITNSIFDDGIDFPGF